MGLVLRDLTQAAEKRADLTSSRASRRHPRPRHETRRRSRLSHHPVTALADDKVRGDLLETAVANKHRIFIRTARWWGSIRSTSSATPAR